MSLAKAHKSLESCLGRVPGRCVVVSVPDQRLHLIIDGESVVEYPVSTAKIGISARENSYGTPPGVHRIHRKIGGGMPAGTVFDSREPTGETWSPDEGEDPESDLILSRILTLEGMEEGINRGPGVDTLARYVYIHGTHHESEIGRPGSRGCVRMKNADIIDLFDRVEEGDAVVIV